MSLSGCFLLALIDRRSADKVGTVLYQLRQS
jgi:hypothetical protein